MLTLLPDYADPERLCSHGKVYAGTIELSELPRLARLLTDAAGTAAFRLEFGRDEDKRPVVAVEVSATLAVRCQRCLETVRQDIACSARLAVVGGPDEAERLPDGLDPLLVDDGRVALRAVVEDELILSIPNAPMHAAEDCGVDLARVNRGGAVADVMRKAPSPFAALATLKRGKETND